MNQTETRAPERPAWWTEQPSSAWERIREAIRRDWEQTKHDASWKLGHELNQNIGSTVKQALNQQDIPPYDGPNPPLVIGNWEDIEEPIAFGYAASNVYGSQHPEWDAELMGLLRRDWDASHSLADQGWGDAKRWVRLGYEGVV